MFCIRNTSSIRFINREVKYGHPELVASIPITQEDSRKKIKEQQRRSNFASVGLSSTGEKKRDLVDAERADIEVCAEIFSFHSSTSHPNGPSFLLSLQNFKETSSCMPH